MRIGIIGGGSIGLLISSFLCKEHDVTIYVRSEAQKMALNKHGLFLSGTIVPFPIKALLIEEIQVEDCFMICVKQYQIAHILPIINHLDKQTPLFFLQNGMGHLQQIKRINHPLFVGIVEHGALRKNSHHVCHAGKGIIKLATYQGEHQILIDLIQKLNQPNFPFEIALEWKQLLAEKLIVNAVINPLTALFDVPNGDVLSNPYIRQLAKGICSEVAYTLQLDDSRQWERIGEIAYQTRENISSMLTDLRNGQQTENEAIMGYLISISKGEIPFTLFIYNSVKALEVKLGIDIYDD